MSEGDFARSKESASMPSRSAQASSGAEDYGGLGKPGITAVNLCLALVAIFGVVAFGGKYAVALFVMQSSVCLLALVVLWKSGWPGLPRVTAGILVVLLAVPLIQMLPLGERIVATVSPARAAIERDVLAPVVGSSRLIPLTINAHATRVATLRLVCYGLVFLLGFYTYKTQRRQPWLVSLLVVLGCLEALYGIVQYLTGSYYLFAGGRGHIGDATGTYTNHNHFAGLLEMVLPFLMARIVFRLPWGVEGSRRKWAQFLSSSVTSRILIDLVLFAVVFVALVFSRSRMGIAAAVAGLLLVLGIAFSQTRRRSTVIVALIVLTLPAAYAVWIGLSPVWERFEVLEQGQDPRLAIWRDTLALIRDYPWWGTGLGTYYWASIRYQTALMNFRYEHAHNDYLEFAAEIGIPVATLLFGSLWVLVARGTRRAVALARTADRVLAAGCSGALASLLIHALTDFNFQIPANAFVFAWIAGTTAGLIVSAPPPVDSRPLR